MDESGLRNNYVFTLIKFSLFLIILCFLVSLSREFWQQLKIADSASIKVLTISIISAFSFYAFITDFNSFYKSVQRFFFHSTFFAYIVPSVLILVGLVYFFLPKIFDINFSRATFVFIGGFIITGHMIFVARGNKGNNFPTTVNYLFIGSIIYILNLLLFTAYLRVGLNINIGKIVFEGVKSGATLIQGISTQAFR